MFSTLPSETIDYILDYLHDDRSALLACSLTCKGWLSCSRYHLFSEVLLHNSNVDSFMELLDIEWTSVGPAIQRLTLDQLEPGSDRNSRPIHASPNVPRLVYHLYNVVSLRVSRVIWENAPQSVQELVSCINFKHLEIRFTSFKTYSQLANIICASPMLHTLSLSGIYWESSGSSALHLQRRPFRLHYLGLHSFGRLRICVEWLLTQSPVPPVQFLCVHLDVAAVEPEVIPFLRTFMRTAGASVERLRILVPTNIPGM
jgi:hypothetical protein